MAITLTLEVKKHKALAECLSKDAQETCLADELHKEHGWQPAKLNTPYCYKYSSSDTGVTEQGGEEDVKGAPGEKIVVTLKNSAGYKITKVTSPNEDQLKIPTKTEIASNPQSVTIVDKDTTHGECDFKVWVCEDALGSKEFPCDPRVSN